MKNLVLLLLLSASGLCSAQQKMPEALPKKLFITLRDSTTSIDLVWMTSKGGSMSMEGHNVQVFSQFFENQPAAKIPGQRIASIMWQQDGREFISGDIYIGDAPASAGASGVNGSSGTTGCIIFNKDGHEYVNLINENGNAFFHDQSSK